MVLSGKPPDYTQCGSSNETNSRCHGDRGHFFLTPRTRTAVIVFRFILASLVVNLTVNLSLREAERNVTLCGFIDDHKVHDQSFRLHLCIKALFMCY